MIGNGDKCPRCGNATHKGAMRCPKCGSLLITPEEQEQRIKKLRETKRKFPVLGLMKFLLLLVFLGVVYHYYGDRLIALVRELLGR